MNGLEIEKSMGGEYREIGKERVHSNRFDQTIETHDNARCAWLSASAVHLRLDDPGRMLKPILNRVEVWVLSFL